jgi:Na+/citrate or Na+/malate symporter
MLFGLALLFFPDFFGRWTNSLGRMSYPLIVTVGHICFFIGAKVYIFDKFIEGYWLVYFFAGILLLNYHHALAEKVLTR